MSRFHRRAHTRRTADGRTVQVSAHDVAARPASGDTAPSPMGVDVARQRATTFDDPLTEEVETEADYRSPGEAAVARASARLQAKHDERRIRRTTDLAHRRFRLDDADVDHVEVALIGMPGSAPHTKDRVVRYHLRTDDGTDLQLRVDAHVRERSGDRTVAIMSRISPDSAPYVQNAWLERRDADGRISRHIPVESAAGLADARRRIMADRND